MGAIDLKTSLAPGFNISSLMKESVMVSKMMPKSVTFDEKLSSIANGTNVGDEEGT